MADIKDEVSCSFCNRKSSEVEQIIRGSSGAICNLCIDKCNVALNNTVVHNDESEQEHFTLETLPTPYEIKEVLDAYVIGQDYAKRTLAVAVYNHYKRIFLQDSIMNDEGIEIEKSNILLMGPSGTGKTLMARTLAKLLDVPFAIVDATSLTEAGYVGEDVENILLTLIQNANNDLSKASRGIIYVDEIDKIARKEESASITRDVSGEGVQQALLKIMEGTIANIPPKGGRKHPNQEYIKLDTSKILFIFAGAFVGLDKIIERRIGGTVMGFGGSITPSHDKKTHELLEQIIPQDLIQFGLIPEFIGRVPILTHTQELTEDELVSVLTEPKNAIIKQYTSLFSLDDVELHFTDEALRSIAQKTIARKVGARGLRNILEHAMLETMFTLPSKTNICRCIITKEVIENNDEPILEYKS